MSKSSVAKSIADIAQRSGFSESTVSRALNDNPMISLETREKIQKIAKEMHYSFNEGARNLRLQKSHTISILINNDNNHSQTLSDPFMMDLISVIADELDKHKYNLLFCSSSIEKDKLYGQLIRSKKSDGIIIIGQGKNDDFIRTLAEMDVPIVVWGGKISHANYCVVGSDNYAGGALAAKQLILDKRKHFLFLGDISHPEIKNRYLGFIDTLSAYGLEGNQKSVSAGFSVQSGYDQILDLMLHEEGFDAVFAASDQIAMGAIKALQANGKQVPKDVSVVGFDHIPFAAYFSPPLTTIKQDIEAGGKLIVSKLINLLNGKTPKSHFLTPTLITGGSCVRAHT